MTIDALPDDVRILVWRYVEKLALPTDSLLITTDKRDFERWLGRRVSASIGGAYVYLARLGKHAVLINLPRIALDRPKALEIVVAEELVHMRDHLDGDYRRHAKHGHDRIAYRVAALTGASLDEVRHPLRPTRQQPFRYVYACPSCDLRVKRRRKGTWSCPRCAPSFDARFVLTIIEHLR